METGKPARAEALSAVLECFPYPALIVDVRRRIRAANRLFIDSQPEAHAVVGRHCYEVLHRRRRRCDGRSAACPVDACRRGAPLTPPVHVHQSRVGQRCDRVVVQPIRNGAGRFVGCLTTLRRVGAGFQREALGNVLVMPAGGRVPGGVRGRRRRAGRRDPRSR